MLSSPLNQWYTDIMAIYRNEPYTEGNIDKKRRILVRENIPCRIYQKSPSYIKMTTTASEISSKDMLSCHPNVDIREGDKLIIMRNGRFHKQGTKQEYFAGEPVVYQEPFGGIMAQLEHQQVPLSSEKRIKK